MNASYFYSRPCGRGDESKKSYGQRKRFLLTPLREGRRKPVTLDAENGIISTHAPAGGATCQRVGSHAGNDIISTHAPAGGATLSTDNIKVWLQPISTHAPAGGAKTTSTLLFGELSYFYSRPCGRGDIFIGVRDIQPVNISTHAPAGGATLWD